MKNNKIILTLLVIFIVAISLSCVSAENNETIIESTSTNDIDISSVNDNSIATNDIGESANRIADNVDMDSIKNVEISNDNVARLSNNIEKADSNAVTWNISNNANIESIQTTIDNANAGDIIQFAENGNYTFPNNGSVQLNVDKTLHFIGKNSTINTRNGFFVQASQTTSIDGITFEGFNFNMYIPIGSDWGRAIDIRGGSNIQITDCSFINGNAGIYIRGSNGNITLRNNYFKGLTNATTINTNSETGTKCINLMGGNGILIENNIFDDSNDISSYSGHALDAISIASNSANIVINNNTINGAWYGIFYGGGLQNITTTNNVFNQTKVYAIGLVKAAQSSTITNNKFILATNSITDNNAAIYLEQGNTAHGAATNIGNVYIKNNDFQLLNNTNIGNKSIYAVKICSVNGELKTNGPLVIADNTYDPEIQRFAFYEESWNFDNGEINMDQYTADTEIVVPNDDVSLYAGSIITLQLDSDGLILPNQLITLTFTSTENTANVVTKNYTTDSMGNIYVENDLTPGNYIVTASYAGNIVNGFNYTASSASFNFTSLASQAIIVGNNMTIASSVAQNFTITLKDENNVLIANDTVTFTINNRNYTRTTDENGRASLTINLNRGTYNMTVSYSGSRYTPVTENYELNVVPSETRILSNESTYNEAGHQFGAQLVDALGNPLANQVIGFHINGVIYYKTTDANGFSYLTINLHDGIYNMYMSYDGTLQYQASNGGSQVITTF